MKEDGETGTAQKITSVGHRRRRLRESIHEYLTGGSRVLGNGQRRARARK